MTATAKIATTATVAAELNTDPRTLRKFLRAAEQGVGKGRRYALPANAKALTTMRKQFAAWEAQVDSAKAAKAEVKATEIDEIKVDEIKVDEVDEIEIDEDFADLDDSIDDL